MSDLYDRDFYAWSNEQVALLRAGNLAAADVENITEEIAVLGRAERRELRRRMTILLLHRLRWQVQPGLRSGSVLAAGGLARDDVEDFLAESPSLTGELVDIIAVAYRQARRQAAIETGMELDAFPADCPWTFDQAMQDPL